MDNSGFIKLSRKLLEWEWHDDPNVLSVWIHLLLSVNWKNGKYRGRVVKAGQYIGSVRKLAEKTGLSVSQTRTALNKLQMTNELNVKSQTFGMQITITKWEEYQGLLDEDSKRFSKQIERKMNTKSQTTSTPNDEQIANQYIRKKEGKKERIKNSASSSPNIYAPGWVDRSGKTRKELEAELNELLNPKRDS